MSSQYFDTGKILVCEEFQALLSLACGYPMHEVTRQFGLGSRDPGIRRLWIDITDIEDSGTAMMG